ncbi:IGF-like family receptor 1 isoform X2 [Rhinolophus sinicus]|uniref:IGF-like family receptor 1 isoform X2 n=1 Tax=Rhinolophus sinicus TaxID=89399 RepID=UPI003D7B0AF0
MGPQAAGPVRMGPHRLLFAVLLLAQAAPQETSQHCGRLQYWNPDNKCCGSCLQRFGPPPCPDYQFSENCGLNDFGDHVRYPFEKCPPGQCNPNSAELCSPCGGGVTAFTHAGTGRRCGEALLTFALPLVLVLLLTSAAIFLFALQRHRRCRQGKVIIHPYPGLACGDSNTHTFSQSSPSGFKEASKEGNSRKVSASTPGQGLVPDTPRGRKVDWKPTLSPPHLHCLPELLNLASQPLSRLLDELEVLEELIVLLDPEPGPGGALACGTTRHLAARYGLPAAWSTFAYSLRPSRSPLRALIEMVVAREPSTSLGQFGTHLAQLGRADALQVLSKLG